MPSIPPECQDIASHVQSLEAAEAAATGALSGLAGAEAWAALAQLASLRRDLAAARSALSSCVASHTGALEVEFVVVNPGPPPLPSGREAQLYEPGQVNPAARSPLVGGRFSFPGPLPPRLSIIVVSQGLPDAFVVDFRTGPLDARDLPAMIRAEVVVGPDVRFTSADVAQWLSAAVPVSSDVVAAPGGPSARVTVTAMSAALSTGQFTLHASGTVDWTLPMGVPAPPNPFTVTVPVVLQLPPTPMDMEPCYVRVVGVPDVQVSGAMGALVAAMVPLVRGTLESTLTAQLQQTVVRGLNRVVAEAFALAELPAGARVSIRRLIVEQDAVTVQPAVGAVGTLLSTFRPPAP